MCRGICILWIFRQPQKILKKKYQYTLQNYVDNQVIDKSLKISKIIEQAYTDYRTHTTYDKNVHIHKL